MLRVSIMAMSQGDMLWITKNSTRSSLLVWCYKNRWNSHKSLHVGCVTIILAGWTLIFTSSAGGLRNIANNKSACLSICLFVRLSTCISQKPNVEISPNYLYVLSVDVALSFSDGKQYVKYFQFCGWRQVFTYWSELAIIKGDRRACFIQFARWRHRGQSLPSPTASYWHKKSDATQSNPTQEKVKTWDPNQTDPTDVLTHPCSSITTSPPEMQSRLIAEIVNIVRTAS